MHSVWPTNTRLGFQMPLACIRALTDVPKRTAMLLRESPNCTVYHVLQLPPFHSAGLVIASGAATPDGAANAAPGSNAPSNVRASMKVSTAPFNRRALAVNRFMTRLLS
jgi:hypothetical protein